MAKNRFVVIGVLSIILVFILIFVGCFNTGQINGFSVKIPTEKGKIDSYFCERDDCENVLMQLINNSRFKIQCAFYSYNLDKLDSMLKQKIDDGIDVSVIYEESDFKSDYLIQERNKGGLMHNKFCIFDDKIVMMGSFNPTHNAKTKEYNNLLVVNSEYLAQNYVLEFGELKNGVYGKGDLVKNKDLFLSLQDINGTYLSNLTRVENLFCPEDGCANEIKEKLLTAKNQIVFMIFTFTDKEISDILIQKHNMGLDVRGIIETKSASGDVIENLKMNGVTLLLENTSMLLHHKVFIIDNEVVITGSMNPTKAADTKNDENVLIVKDRYLANRYLDEYNRSSDSLIN